uniref:Uncharacterized protein n=1 Tax=Anguilla anguilla TaxID=7936 RepID=A0A0E9WYI8_ANGAN
MTMEEEPPPPHPPMQISTVFLLLRKKAVDFLNYVLRLLLFYYCFINKPAVSWNLCLTIAVKSKVFSIFVELYSMLLFEQ